MSRRRTGYWALAATPRSYRIEAAIRGRQEDSWITMGKEIRAGDRAIIWKCKANEKKRGVVAFAEILTDPKVETVRDNEYRVDSSERSEAQFRVMLRYITLPKLPLWCEDNPKSIVNRLSVKRACGGTVFYIEPEEWLAIIEEVGGWPS